jgi:hypothetical protein
LPYYGDHFAVQGFWALWDNIKTDGMVLLLNEAFNPYVLLVEIMH